MSFISVSGKNWIFKEFNDLDIKKFSENYSLSEIAAKLLSIRKKSINNIDLFLNPTIKNLLPNPLKLKDMESATKRAYDCIVNNETIGIFGDYDVDGASSTALLSKYFLSIKRNIKTYIPDRKKEGYGPSINGFNNLIKFGANLIFTVDCGTLSFKAVEDAQRKKIDIIVLDHHQSELKLPNACAIVNPNRFDDTSNLNYLCAAGVCFMFLVSLNKKLRDENWFRKNKIDEPNILDFLDLVSLATVCDVVPLIDLNRAIVKQGLKILKRRKNLGLKTLYDLCKIESQPTTYHLGYVLGPRINAGGRVGKSSHGVELLISNDPQKTFQIANELNKSNDERKSIELLLFQEINKILENYKNDPVLVLSGKNWHEGIIGIIASRIKDKYNKPAIIISIDENIAKGSARSVVGFDIGSQIIKAVQLGLIEKGGGHKMAGGFTLKTKNIPSFKNFLIKNFLKSSVNKSKVINLYIDSVIAPSALNLDFFKEIENLAPFGSANIEPKFVVEDIKVINSNIIADKHIKSLLCGKDGTVFKSIYFNGNNTRFADILSKDYKKNFNIAGRLSLNEWKGKKNIEFVIEDIAIK